MKKNNTYEKYKNIRFTIDEIIEGLIYAKKSSEYIKSKPEPKFTVEDFWFIRDLIFWKPKDLIIYYIANKVMWHNKDLRYISNIHFGAQIKLLKFFHNYLNSLGNATKAAKAAGYSAKTARQAGHRALRRIQNYMK